MLSQLINKPSLDSLGLPFTAILTSLEAVTYRKGEKTDGALHSIFNSLGGCQISIRGGEG